MNKEYLQDYEKKEIEEQKELYKNVLDGSFKTIKEGYLKTHRFNLLNDPIITPDYNAYNQYGLKLWSQIPFAGTVIISIENCSPNRELFSKVIFTRTWIRNKRITISHRFSQGLWKSSIRFI